LEDLKTYKLEDLGFLGRGKSRHRPRNDPSLFGGKYPFIQTGEVKSAEFYINSFEDTYNDKGLEQSKLWDPGTLLITIAANIAETAILDIKACFPDSILGFIPDEDKADVRFIKYYIDTIKLKMQSISRGTTQDNLSLQKLRSIDFIVPPVSKQRRIAGILSAFDDLIENNTRRIEILEEMARRIYREWFVHFRYPGHDDPSTSSGQRLVDSGTDMGEIPEGWEVGTVGELYQVKSGHPFKSKKLMDEGNYGVIKIGNITDTGEIEIGDVQYLEDDVVPDRARKYLLNPGDILIAMTGAKVGKIGIMPKTPNNYYLNQRVGKYFSKVEGVHSHMFLYSYLKTDFAQTMIKHLAQGAAQPNISATNLKSLKLVIPTDDIFENFEKKTQPLRDQMLLLRQKNRKLKATRDLLLPKLISGKIDVEDVMV